MSCVVSSEVSYVRRRRIVSGSVNTRLSGRAGLMHRTWCKPICDFDACEMSALDWLRLEAYNIKTTFITP